MVQHSKCCVDESQPRVRIPLSAPKQLYSNPRIKLLFCTEKGILRSLVISAALTGFGNPLQAVAFAIGNNNQHTQKTAERISLSLRVSLFRRSAPYGNPPQAVAFAIGNNNQHTQETAERISLSLRVSLFRRSAPYGNPLQAVAFAVGNNNQHTQGTAERISLSLRV